VPPFDLPFYSEETLAGARDLIERVLLPRVVGRSFRSPPSRSSGCGAARGVRGNWFARRESRPPRGISRRKRAAPASLSLLGERVARNRPPRSSAASPWGFPRSSPRYPDQMGVRGGSAWLPSSEIKVAPGWECGSRSRGPHRNGRATLPLTVDANGAYEWPRDEAALRALDDAGLLYIEQPLHPTSWSDTHDSPLHCGHRSVSMRRCATRARPGRSWH